MQAALFRAMADEYWTKDPMVSVTMRESADFFETLATEVHTAAVDIDEQARLFVRPGARVRDTEREEVAGAYPLPPALVCLRQF